MKSSMNVIGENTDHKIAAVFESVSDAEGTAKALCEETGMAEEQVVVVSPDDREQGRELEPESQGIWRTMIRSHLALGIAGAVVGFIVFLVLSALGIDFITQNSLVAASVIVALAAVLGLLVAGAVSVRPDHTPYLMKAQAALRKGNYVLTVHADSLKQLDKAKTFLKDRGVKTIQTI